QGAADGICRRSTESAGGESRRSGRMSSGLLEIKDLHASVAGQPVLRGITLSVGAGEVHAIMGPNGSGKSTLAHVLAGRPGYQITAGKVTFDGIDLLSLAPEERAHEGV